MQRLVLCLAVFLALALVVSPAWAHGPHGLDARSARTAEAIVVLVEPAATAEAVAQIEQVPDPLPVERPRVGTVEGARIVAVVLGLASLRRARGRGRRTTIAATTVALVLSFILEITPHLVHHSLDADQGAGCEALQAAERSHVVADAIDATPVTTQADLADGPPVAARPTCAAPSPRGRAPPA